MLLFVVCTYTTTDIIWEYEVSKASFDTGFGQDLIGARTLAMRDEKYLTTCKPDDTSGFHHFRVCAFLDKVLAGASPQSLSKTC